MSDPAALRIQHYLRVVLELKRELVPAGAYVLYVHPRERHPAHNYAVPRAEARTGDGRRLVRAARERGLVPRVEYVAPCFPWVEEALARAGFVREEQLRLMTLAPAGLTAPSADAELVAVRPGSPLVGPMRSVSNAAFGDPPPTEEDVSGWQGEAIAAVSGGELVGCAAWTQVIDGVSEIVGVAVSAGARRRGIGAAVTAAAAAAAFAQGAELAVLTPAGEEQARVYERVGFADTSTMLHLVLPGDPRRGASAVSARPR